ncbi:uncharacterized protein CBL_00376 [Carabus blaptoides fortunei]
MSKIPERDKQNGRPLKSMDQHNRFLSRITKTLYYGKLPKTDRLSLPVSELASELFSEAQQGHSLNRLYCEEASNISRNACVSPCSFVLALLYLERLKNCNPEYLRQVAPSKLFLVSLMISSKFLHDDGEEDEVFMDEWAHSGDINVSELCQLEKDFLGAIDWNVFVREHTFWDRFDRLETDVALRQGSKRGWFTYTELKYLINVYEINQVLQTLVAVSAVLAATYTVGVLTLVGSVFLTSHIPGTSLHTPVKEDLKILIENNRITANGTTDIDIIVSQALEDIRYETKSYYKVLDAVDVLKTGFILASITCDKDFSDCDVTQEQDCTSWDWWNNPVMNWLTDISRNDEHEGIRLPDNYYKNFAHDKLTDMSIASQKKLQLEDKIHKATKVRLQEQLERSWHEEWTDTVFTTLGPYLSQISAY